MYKYYNARSDIHNMSPVYKFICLLLFCFLLIIFKSVLLLIIISIYVFLSIITTKVPLKLYLNNLKTMLSLIIFILLIDIIFGVSTFIIVLTVSKILLIILYTSILTFTTTPNEITSGLDKLLSPLKLFNIKTSNIAMSLSLAIRFIPIIFEQGNKVLKSQASRGLDFNDKNLKIKFQSLTSILIPMFMLSFKRADDIADIMELRVFNIDNMNFNNKKYNTSFNYLILSSHIILFFIYILKEVIRI